MSSGTQALPTVAVQPDSNCCQNLKQSAWDGYHTFVNWTSLQTSEKVNEYFTLPQDNQGVTLKKVGTVALGILSCLVLFIPSALNELRKAVLKCCEKPEQPHVPPSQTKVTHAAAATGAISPRTTQTITVRLAPSETVNLEEKK